jgi:hypothetical protein
LPPWSLPSCPSPSLRRQRIRSPSTHRRPVLSRCLLDTIHVRTRGDDVHVGERNQGRCRQPHGYNQSFTALVARASMTCLPAASGPLRSIHPAAMARPLRASGRRRRRCSSSASATSSDHLRGAPTPRHLPGPWTSTVSDPMRRRRVGAITVTATVPSWRCSTVTASPLRVACDGLRRIACAAAMSRSRARSVSEASPLPWSSRPSPRPVPRSSGAYDVFAGSLRDVFRSIDAAAPTHSRCASAAVANCSPCASRRAPA